MCSTVFLSKFYDFTKGPVFPFVGEIGGVNQWMWKEEPTSIHSVNFLLCELNRTILKKVLVKYL